MLPMRRRNAHRRVHHPTQADRPHPRSPATYPSHTPTPSRSAETLEVRRRQHFGLNRFSPSRTRPVIAEVVEKYLACGILNVRLRPRALWCVQAKSICSRSGASAATSARVATRSAWRFGVCGWRRPCSRTYPSGRWCSPSPSTVARARMTRRPLEFSLESETPFLGTHRPTEAGRRRWRWTGAASTFLPRHLIPLLYNNLQRIVPRQRPPGPSQDRPYNGTYK